MTWYQLSIRNNFFHFDTLFSLKFKKELLFNYLNVLAINNATQFIARYSVTSRFERNEAKYEDENKNIQTRFAKKERKKGRTKGTGIPYIVQL